MDKDVYAAWRRLRAPLIWLPCFLVNTAVSAPNVLSKTSHGAPNIAQAINAVLGTGVVDRAIFVDFDEQDPIADLTQATRTTFSAASGAQVTHAPYMVANASFCCSAGAGDDGRFYQALQSSAAILSNAAAFGVGGPLPVGTAPPVSTTTTSSPNSGNGGTGWGIEFGLSASYLGLDTSEDSFNTGNMAGLLAALKNQHPTWTWFDVKAALRQTAGNWATGYSHLHFGYGLVDWFAANAIPTPGSLFLQPPGVQIDTGDGTAIIQLFPFRQTRRAREVVYSVDPTFSWPAGRNELTTADIAAADGKLLFTSNGTDLIATFSIQQPGSVPLWIIAFTTDGAGHFSRVEEFSLHRIADLGIADVPIPAWAQMALATLLLALAIRIVPANSDEVREFARKARPTTSATTRY